jgi:dCMP deaminase
MMGHDFYFRLAIAASLGSKDPSTQCGAVLVRPDGSVAGIGFNKIPYRGTDDHRHLYSVREEKYPRIVHAEMDAIYSARAEAVDGYTIYCFPMMPCDRCMAHLAHWGIRRVYHPPMPEDQARRWSDSQRLAIAIALENRILLTAIDIHHLRREMIHAVP